MSNHDKEKAVYTKEMLIKTIASKCDVKNDTVKNIVNSLGDEITELLSTANEQTDVVLRLFSGISISSTFVPEHERMNNLTGEMMTCPAKIKAKAAVTRHYCDIINGCDK